ncbi:MAG TPA: hypothetical protein VGK25_13330 [Ignavibacteria bacterium]|jgi:hypothetical protein
METLNKPILVLFLVLQFYYTIHSQNITQIDSYTSSITDEKKMNKNKMRIVLSFGGGFATISNKNNFNNESSFQLSALLPLGKFMGLRLDMGYSNWFKDDYNTEGYDTISGFEIYDSYGEQTKESYNIKTDLVLGNFSTNKFWFYISAGIGLNFLRDGGYVYEHILWHWWIGGKDTIYSVPATSNFGALYSVGSTLGYRFTKKFGIYTDFQLINAARKGFDFSESLGFMPIRAGFTYTIY